MEAPELRADINSSSAEGGHLGAFKASGDPGNHSDTTSTSGMMKNRTGRTGFYDNDSSLNSGSSTTGFYDKRLSSGTQAIDNLETRRSPTSIVAEQTSRHGRFSSMDRKLMHSVRSDIHAMHSIDPEEFEGVASKIDETFGCNALM